MEWKKEEEFTFLTEVSCIPHQHGLRHLQTAFSNFFTGRAKYPNFKIMHHGGSAELAKSAEPLAIRWSRLLPQGVEPATVTVKLSPSGR